MKNLKDILSEGVLGDTDDILRAGDKFVNQEERDKIKAELAVRSWYAITSDEMFNRIVDSCEQLNDADKKGSRWTLIIPDETSTFKPIFVNLAKGVYRFTKRADKELYGTTVSAMHKRIVKEVKTYKDEGLSTGWITNKSISFLAFLMNEYTRVNSISGNNWYTISIYKSSTTQFMISYNPITQEWAYGANSNVPSWVNATNINKFITLSNIILGDELHKALFISYLKDFEVTLPHGNPKDFKKTSKFWKRIKFAGGQTYGYKDIYLYVHTTNFVYLTSEDIATNTTNNNSGSTSSNTNHARF